MIGAVGHAVGGAVVAAGYGDGDAEGGGCLAGLVHGGEGLLGPGGLGAAPGNGDDGGLAGGVVNGGGDGVEEALVGIGGEVDGDGGALGYGSGDFDVEEDFAVGAVGVTAWDVVGSVDRDGGDGGWSEAETVEVGLEIGSLVAAAEFDDADGLSGSADTRELVSLRDLDRGVRDVGGVGGGEAGVGLGLRTVIEAEDGADVRGEFFGDGDWALAGADLAVGDGLGLELGAEGALEIGQGSGELDGGAGCGEVGLNLEVVLLGEFLDEGDRVWVGAVPRLELFGGEAGLAESGEA